MTDFTVDGSVVENLGDVVGGAPRWLRFVAAFSEFDAPGVTTDTVTLYANPSSPIILIDAFFNLTVEFSGGTVATATLSIGKTGTVDALMLAEDVFTGAVVGLKNDATTKGTDIRDDLDMGGGDTKLESPLLVPAGTAITMTLVTTIGDTDELAAGSADVYICVAEPLLTTIE